MTQWELSVEAFAASWIEITQEKYSLLKKVSKPLRLRGLKSRNSFVNLPDTASKPLRLRGLKFLHDRVVIG